MSLTHALVGKDGFRLRGEAMSRIDGFSDVVFGFALTLIVASLEVPKTFNELHDTMIGFVPFFVCFVFLMMVWLTHFRFFRRFGLHDMPTILINAGLLFTILFYVYPMKFLFVVVTKNYVHVEEATAPIFSHVSQARELVLLYALGYTAIYACLSGLNLHAWRIRKQIDLNPLEELILKSELVDLTALSVIGVLVEVVALILPPDAAFGACFVFMIIAPWKTITGTIYGKKIRLLREQTIPEPLPTTR
jgi:uncharacterized membrane protein